MGNNEVAFNHIHHHMNTLTDGGGIYTLGSQPSTRVHHNYVHDQANEYGAMYPDEGSSYMRWDSNVVKGVNRWFFMANGGTRGNAIVGNYSDTHSAIIRGEDCQIDSNTVIADGQWPDDALGIMVNAGLEKPYRKALLGPGTDAGGEATPGPAVKKQTTSIRNPPPQGPEVHPSRPTWNWVAPGQARNILGRLAWP